MENNKKKQIKKSGKMLIALGIVVFILIVFILLLVFKKDKDTIIGKWESEMGTIYEFNEDKTGKLILTSEEYPFTYKMGETVVFVDFENPKSIDTKFEYKFEDKKLILKNSNGSFTFTKID